jgi:hypothetical protein
MQITDIYIDLGDTQNDGKNGITESKIPKLLQLGRIKDDSPLNLWGEGANITNSKIC